MAKTKADTKKLMDELRGRKKYFEGEIAKYKKEITKYKKAKQDYKKAIENTKANKFYDYEILVVLPDWGKLPLTVKQKTDQKGKELVNICDQIDADYETGPSKGKGGKKRKNEASKSNVDKDDNASPAKKRKK